MGIVVRKCLTIGRAQHIVIKLYLEEVSARFGKEIREARNRYMRFI